jgi:ABC-type nitrate/sulfonate/bicarbonate transport system substrate-binding protein
MMLVPFVRAAFAGLLLAAAMSASAQTILNVPGLRTIALLPVQHALKQGYFKREGLDVILQVK